MGLTPSPEAPGVALAAPETLLTSRALDYLAAGPADAQTLVSHVCQLPGAPRAVAEHIASSLFAGDKRFVREADGRWRVTAVEERHPTVVTVAGEALHGLSYVVVDVETTGGRSDAGDRVTEIAVVRVQGDGTAPEVVFDSLVNPERPIPRYITALTNISWDMVKDAPPFREVCPRLLEVLEGHVFVAHNAAFDWRFLSMEVERATGRTLEGRRLCTVKLARKLLPQLRRRSLDYVAAHYAVDIGARHRAGGDALATAHVLLRMLADARDRGCTTWDDLERLLGATARKRRPRRPSALPQPVSKDTTA